MGHTMNQFIRLKFQHKQNEQQKEEREKKTQRQMLTSFQRSMGQLRCIQT